MPNNFPEAMSSSDHRLFTTKRRRRRKVTAQNDQRTTASGTRRVADVSSSPAPSPVPSPPPFRPLLLLLLLLWPPSAVCPSAVQSAGGHCPQWVNDEIQQCVQPVADFAKTLNKEQQQTEDASATSPPASTSSAELGQALQWPTKMGGVVFQELCRLIKDFEQCVDVFRQRCRRHITISLIEASYGFLCNEGYNTFMTSAECLMELDQRPNVKRCHDRTLKSIEAANTDGGEAVGTKLDKMCSALSYFSDCVRVPIRQSCGVEAWRVIFRVLKDTTRTLMPKCEFDESKEVRGGGERRQKEEEGGDEERGEIAGTNDKQRVKENEEINRKGERDREEEGTRTRNTGRGKTNGEWAEAARTTEGRKDDGVANGRVNAMAPRHNAKPMTMPTATAEPNDEWEQWEEEETEEGTAGNDAFAQQQQQRDDERDNEMHHQIHYGSQPMSRNDAMVAKGVPMRTVTTSVLLGLLAVPFLFSFGPIIFHFFVTIL